MKVKLEPSLEQIRTDNGVGQVIENHLRYFPEFDIEIVSGDTFDISASHLGYNVDADVHHNHGLWLGGLDRERGEQNALIIESCRRAKQVIVPSNYVAAYFQRDMRLDPNVIGHGVNWEEWQSPDNHGYILWDKNRRSAVCNPRPVTVLATAFPSLPFVTTFVEEDVHRHNIYETGRIEFEKMRTVVQRAHVYLATTKETFGIATLQAMAAGIPIVGYDWGGTADIVRKGIDGILVKPKDEEALKEALTYVLIHRDDLGSNARDRAKEFSWKNVVEKIANVYRRAAIVEEPTVSVIIPVYNYAGVLTRAVQSAAEQTYALLKEIIIVDDGSTDDTHFVAQQLMERDPRIKYIRQDNSGVAVARNTGIEHATSKYICCLDADDEIKPSFLEKMIHSLENFKALRLAYSKIELVFENGNRGTGPWPDAFDGDAMLRGENQIPTCCVFYKEDWQRLGGYKQRYCPKGFGAEDAEFWLRFTKHGYRAGLASREPLFVYHLGGGTSKDYKEPNYLAWHTDLETGWLPFSAISENEIHEVTEYDQPTYSIIIPVGPGHEPYLEDALDSVEAQSDKRWECIVVWNMRPEVLFSNPIVDRLHFAYPFVKFINAYEKLGAGYARNTGAQHASGEYLVFLDADDYLQPKFLELTRKAREHFKADWVYTDLYTQTDDGMELFECKEWNVDTLWRRGIMGVTCLYTRKGFDLVGGFDEEYNREDWDFHMRLAKAGLCGLRLPFPLFTYRQQLGFRREYYKIAKTAEESMAMKLEDVARIHTIFNVEELKVACSGCSNQKVEIETVSNNELSTMDYTSSIKARAHGVTFKGPVTGTAYRANNGVIFNVHPQDAEVFEVRRLFKRRAKPRVIAVAEPIVAQKPKAAIISKKTWGEEVQQINEQAMKASNAARDDTAKMMREMFGDAFSDLPSQPVETDEPVDPWWKTPSERTVGHNQTLLAQNKLTREQLNIMEAAEEAGKNRVTLKREIHTRLDSG